MRAREAARAARAVHGLCLVLLLAASGPGRLSASELESVRFEIASVNASRSAMALRQVHFFLTESLKAQDAETALIGDGDRGDRWTLEHTATEFYPRLVLASWLTDRQAFDGVLRQTLADEAELTSRLGRLPDDYSLAGNTFLHPGLDSARVLHGSVAYAADGLAAITAQVGADVWQHRTRSIVDDILSISAVQTPYAEAALPSADCEVNGKLLCLLPQLAAQTGDSTYLDWARQIADVYCLGILPESGGIPVRTWRPEPRRRRGTGFPLDARGLPIIRGLTVLFAGESQRDTERSRLYLPVLSHMYQVLLTHARTPEGLFYARIHADGRGGYAVDRKNRSPAWPGLLSSALLFGHVTGNTVCTEAVKAALKNLPGAHTQLWGSRPEVTAANIPAMLSLCALALQTGAISDRDAELLLSWIDVEMQEPLRRLGAMPWKTESTLNRSTLAAAAMAYAWLKSGGLRLEEWRQDLSLGVHVQGDTLYASLRAERRWDGWIRFAQSEGPVCGVTRSLAQGFPTWFGISSEHRYGIDISGAGGTAIWSGAVLAQGLRAAVDPGTPVHIRIARYARTPEPLPEEPDTLRQGRPTGERGSATGGTVLRAASPP